MFCVLGIELSNKSKGYAFTDSLISNINCVEDGYDIIENELEVSLIDNMLKAKVYSSESNIIRAIKNRSLTKIYTVQIITNQDNLKESSKEPSSIMYYYYPLNNHDERYVIFGRDNDYKRWELMDNCNTNNVLKLGQHIEFKYKDMVLDGYVSSAPCVSESYSNMYEVIIRKGKSYDLLWGDDQIHYRDITKLLDGSWSVNELYDIIVKHNDVFTYLDSYLDELSAKCEY